MGCDMSRDKSDREQAGEDRWYKARRIIESFSEVFVGSFKLKELLLIHKLSEGKQGLYVSEEDFALLKATKRRIFGYKAASKSSGSAWVPGRNHI